MSFFNDASSQILVKVLPLHLAFNLGISLPLIGLIEGLSESLAVATKGLSGWLSDRVESRKGFVAGGYTLSAASRFLFLFLGSPTLLAFGRLLDRVGKGLRCPARDALVADSAAAGGAGRAFGWACMLDSLGAAAGLGVVLFLGMGDRSLSVSAFRTCVQVAVPMGLVATLLVLLWVPRVTRITASKRFTWKAPASIQGFLPIVFLFGLASSSDAFLILRAKGLGIGFQGIMAILVGHHLVAACVVFLAGRLSDRFSRGPFLAAGWATYAAAYAVMGLTDSWRVFAGMMVLYGAFYGMTEGVLRALAADLLTESERGKGYGSLQVVLGLAALLASPLMGFAVVFFGYQAALLGTSLVALFAALWVHRWTHHRKDSMEFESQGIKTLIQEIARPISSRPGSKGKPSLDCMPLSDC